MIEKTPTIGELYEAIYAKRFAALARQKCAGAGRTAGTYNATHRPRGIALKILRAAEAGPVRRDGRLAVMVGVNANSINGSTSTLVTHGFVIVSDETPATITITEAGLRALEMED